MVASLIMALVHSLNRSLILLLIGTLVASSLVPMVDWSSFMQGFKWKQGEHVLMVAPTGMGKTVLNKQLLRYREQRKGYICVLATKPVDDELTELEGRRY